MVTLMGVFRKSWVFQKVLPVTSYKNGDKNKLTGMLNVKLYYTAFVSEKTLMYEIPWPPGILSEFFLYFIYSCSILSKI
jgi:hypothetical protein